MDSTGGALNFDAMIRDTNFNRTIQNMERRVIGFTDKTITETQKMDSAFSQFGRAAAGYFAFTELSQLPGKIVQVRGEFQQLEISFNTMLGSKAKANKLMADVTRFAAVTPYGLKDTAAATKQLLAYGEGADTVTSTLRKLGDIASGINAPLGDIAYLYGTTMTQGRLYTQDLNQFTGRGIPMIKELAKIFGVAESEVKALVEAGKVGFPEVQRVIENLTKSGSMFGGLMEAQSKSLPGLIAQLEDAIDMMFNDIGKANEGLAAGVITGATSIVENYQEVIDILKVIVATYGAYKAVLISTVAVQKLAAVGRFYDEYMAMGKALGFATANQIAFNRAVLANPYAIAAAAIIGLITAVNVFKEDTSEAAKAQERIANSTDKVNESLAGELSKVQLLTTQIKNENVSRDERNKKLNELISLHPKILGGITQENIATAEGTKAINAYIEARKRQIEVEQLNLELTESIKRQLDAKNGKNELSFMSSLALSMSSAGGSGLTAGTGTDFTNASVSARKKLNSDIVKQEAELQKSILERVNALNSADSAIDKNSAKTEQSVKKTVEWYDQEIKALKEKQSKEADSRRSFLAYQKQIDDLERQRTRIVGAKATKSDSTKSVKEESGIAIKTLNDELEEKRKLYELYYRWVDVYGEEVANRQFESLVSQNKSYLDYLNTQISKLESLSSGPGLTDSEAGSLANLIGQRNELTGVESPMQKFAKELDDAKDSADTLTEYLEILKQKQADLIGTDNSSINLEKKKELAERLIGGEKELKAELLSMLKEYGSYSLKKLNIDKRYDEARKTAVKNFRGIELEEALKAAETRRKAETEALNDEEQEKSETYNRISKEYVAISRKQLQISLENIETELKRAEISAKRRKELEQALADTKRALTDKTEEGYRNAADIISKTFGDSSLKISKTFEISINRLTSLISNIGTLSNKSSTQMAKVSSLIDIFSFVTVAVRDATMTQSDLLTGMEAQESYYKSIASEIQGINMLLERQKFLLENMTGDKKSSGMLEMIESYGQEQIDALEALKQLQVDIIKSADEIYVDPIFGTEEKAKGWGKRLWAQLITAGQVKTKIKYEFEAVDTTGLETIEDWIEFRAELAKNGNMIGGKLVTEADLQAIDDLIERFRSAEEAQKQLIEDFKVFLTGTTQEAIVNSLVDGFKSGKSSAADFASDFEGMMQNALLNSLKAEMMNEGMAEFYKRFSDYSYSDGELTAAEIGDLKSVYEQLVADGKKRFDEIQQITGISLGNTAQKAMSGVISGMSAEQGSKLDGQFNAMRIMQAESNRMMTTQLFHLAGIERNTARLEQIENSLKSMDRKMSGRNIDDTLRGKGYT